jgi:uncharacterized protein
MYLAATACLGLVFAAVARSYLSHYTLNTPATISIYLAFMLLLAMATAPGFWNPTTIAKTRLRIAAGPLLAFVAIWCSPYVIYTLGTGDFRWAALFKLLEVAVPVLAIYAFLPVHDSPAFSWQDAFVAAWLIAAVLLGWLKGVWNVPINLDFMSRLFLITIASWCWSFVRPVPELGYDFRVSGKVMKQAVINFALFAVIAIPSSLAMRFTAWNPRWHGIVPFLLNYLDIFLFIALLEELFFRGFLQTLLSKTFGSWVAGQATVSCLFGLFHIMHAPFPNWRYVALASVAGWFYGSAFRKSGSIMASALVHAAVDTVWRTWLSAH